MQVTVSFLGTLADQLGTRSLAVELQEEATYRDLLDRIAPAVESKLAAWAWDPSKRAFSRQMLVSRNLSGDLRDETTMLADGDEILIVLPLAGG